MHPAITDDPIDFRTAAPAAGSLEVAWIHGSPSRKASREPLIQVHHYDEHTVIMRQSKSVSYEAPFLYLLFGNDRALLLDTGATAGEGRFPLRATVDELIDGWLSRHPREHYELIVAHSHGHGDHVAADGQFAGRPATTVVSRELEAVQEFFGFTSWPDQIVALDLGGRVLEVAATPGHHRAAITIFDPWAGFLLTGDTVLPGRLYVEDHRQFLASLNKMTDLAAARSVTYVLGCHVEMTREPGRDFPLGATYQPGERALQLTTGQLGRIRDAVAEVAGRRGVHRFDDAILYNEPRKRDVIGLMARGLAHKALAAFPRS